MIEGAVFDAMLAHPDYYTDKGRKSMVESVTKRAIGAVLHLAHEVRKDGRGFAPLAPLLVAMPARPVKVSGESADGITTVAEGDLSWDRAGSPESGVDKNAPLSPKDISWLIGQCRAEHISRVRQGSHPLAIRKALRKWQIAEALAAMMPR